MFFWDEGAVLHLAPPLLKVELQHLGVTEGRGEVLHSDTLDHLQRLASQTVLPELLMSLAFIQKPANI